MMILEKAVGRMHRSTAPSIYQGISVGFQLTHLSTGGVSLSIIRLDLYQRKSKGLMLSLKYPNAFRGDRLNAKTEE